MKKTNKNLAGIVGLLVVAFIAVVVGVSSYVKASSNSAKYNAEGNMIVNEAPATSDATLGSSSETNAFVDTDFTEVGLISQSVSKKWVGGVTVENMPAVGVATTTLYFKNETGAGMYIDSHNMFAQFSGTVSSTVAFACGTSTLTGIAAYTTTPPVNIIAATNVVTSTVSVANAQGLVQVATTMAGLHYLGNGESVVCAWYQPYDNGCTGSKCEAVTSTNRGYTAQVVIPYYKLQQY